MKKLIKRIRRLITNAYFLFSVILLLGLGLRLYKIHNRIADWHSWRQADTAAVTRIYVDKGINLLYPRYYDISSIQSGLPNVHGYRFVEFPFYNALHALLVKNFTFFSLEMWGRLLSVFFSLLSGVVLYLIGKKLMGKWGGILSMLFFLTIPFNIYFSRVILPEPMTVFFGVLSVYLFMLFIEKDKKSFLYLSALTFAVTMLLKPYMVFYTVPMAYLAIKKYGWRDTFLNAKILIPFLIFANIALVPFFAWRIWENRYPQGIPYFSWAFNGDGIRFKPSFWQWIFGERIGHLILGAWGLIPFIFGLLKTKGKKYFIHFFLLGVFLYVSVVATANVRHDYYQTIIIPAIALALAQGSLYMWTNKDFSKWPMRALLLFSLMVMYVTGWSQIKGDYQINHPEIIEAGQAVDQLTPKDAKVIAPYDGDTAFLYQTKRFGWPVVETSFDKLINMGATYYVSVNFADPDTIKLMGEYQTVKKTGSYILIDLTKPLKN